MLFEILGIPDWGLVPLGIIGIIVIVMIDRKVFGRKW